MGVGCVHSGVQFLRICSVKCTTWTLFRRLFSDLHLLFFNFSSLQVQHVLLSKLQHWLLFGNKRFMFLNRVLFYLQKTRFPICKIWTKRAPSWKSSSWCALVIMHSERSNASDPLEKYVKNAQALIVLLKMSKFFQRFMKNSSKLLAFTQYFFS